MGCSPYHGPRLDALRQGVVHDDRDVDVLGLVTRHVLLELLIGVGDDREVLRGNAVTLGAVSYRPNAMPHRPDLRAESTIPRVIRAARFFWKMPR
jgi:hypothetical protein